MKRQLAVFLGFMLCSTLPGCVPLAIASAPAAAVSMQPVADAAPLTPDDARDIRAAIQAQLDAFAADDADAAFGQAAPGIREMFGTPERFMGMVREQYPAVYRPASVSFLPVEGNGSEAIQGVRLQDAAGVQWLAAYLMQRQGDKSWRIGGCQLVYEGKGLTT